MARGPACTFSRRRQAQSCTRRQRRARRGRGALRVPIDGQRGPDRAPAPALRSRRRRGSRYEPRSGATERCTLAPTRGRDVGRSVELYSRRTRAMSDGEADTPRRADTLEATRLETRPRAWRARARRSQNSGGQCQASTGALAGFASLSIGTARVRHRTRHWKRFQRPDRRPAMLLRRRAALRTPRSSREENLFVERGATPGAFPRPCRPTARRFVTG